MEDKIIYKYYDKINSIKSLTKIKINPQKKYFVLLGFEKEIYFSKIEYLLQMPNIILVLNNLWLWLHNKKNELWLGPQYFFINFEPLNIIKNKETLFLETIDKIKNYIKKAEKFFNIQINWLFLFSWFFLYFLWLEKFTKNNFYNLVNLFKEKIEKKIIIQNETVFSFSDRIYEYFVDKWLKTNRITNKKILEEILKKDLKLYSSINDKKYKNLIKNIYQIDDKKLDILKIQYKNNYQSYFIKWLDDFIIFDKV